MPILRLFDALYAKVAGAMAARTGFLPVYGIDGAPSDGDVPTWVAGATEADGRLVFTAAGGTGGGIEDGDLLGEACHVQPLFTELGGHFKIPALPADETDLADLWGQTEGAHFKKVLGAGKHRVRVQRTLASAGAGTIAFQYFDGSEWRYLDGVGGPVVELETADLLAGAWVPVEAAAAGDRVIRPVVLGGDDATDVIGSMLALEWCQAPVNAPDDPETGDSSGDCSIVESDGLEYTNRAAMEAAGWFLTAEAASPGNSFAWDFDTANAFEGTYAFKGTIARNAGFPGGTNLARKIFTGFDPNTWHTVSVRARQEEIESWDTYTRLAANNVESPDRLTTPATYQLLKISVLSDSAGKIDVELRRVVPQLHFSEFVQFWFDDLKIQVGRDCDPSGGCTLVVTNDLVYADDAAAAADGWTLEATTYSATITGHATDRVFDGNASSIRMGLNFVFGGTPNQFLRALKTFGAADGLLPSTAYTVKIWVNQSAFIAGENFTRLLLNGTSVAAVTPLGGWVANTWKQLIGTATTDGSGDLTVAINRDVGYNYTQGQIYIWLGDIKIYEGSEC